MIIHSSGSIDKNVLMISESVDKKAYVSEGIDKKVLIIVNDHMHIRSVNKALMIVNDQKNCVS